MHVLPVLDKVEKKYEKQLVVVGVHSAKFETEKETENIKEWLSTTSAVRCRHTKSPDTPG
jgi:thiol-disulfide isomerase/thioredoxin